MKVLKLATSNNDQVNTFTFKGFRVPMPCSLHRGYNTADDGIYWAMKHDAILKSEYTEADFHETMRINSGSCALEDGEVVEIEGEQYITRFYGDYSDCAVFQPAAY